MSNLVFVKKGTELMDLIVTNVPEDSSDEEMQEMLKKLLSLKNDVSQADGTTTQAPLFIEGSLIEKTKRMC